MMMMNEEMMMERSLLKLLKIRRRRLRSTYLRLFIEFLLGWIEIRVTSCERRT